MAQYGVKEVMNFTIAKYNADPKKAKPILTVDYATVTDVQASAERLDINGGRGNKRLLSFDHTKVASLPISLPLVDLEMLAIISGDKIEDVVKDVFKKEVLTTKTEDGKVVAELKKVPVDGSLYVHKVEGFRDLGEAIEVVPAVPTALASKEGTKVAARTLTGTQCSLSVSGSTAKIEFGPEIQAGTEIMVFYHTTTTKAVKSFKCNPELFAQAVTLFGDTLFRNQFTEEDEVYNFVAYKGRFQPNYTLSMNSTSATVLELTLDLYACKDKATQSETYYEFIKEEVEEA